MQLWSLDLTWIGLKLTWTRGAFDGDSGMGGVGIVIRDHQGASSATFMVLIRQATRPAQVEALAGIG